MRARKDNQIDLAGGGASTIGHTERTLDISRSTVYSLASGGHLEFIYLDPANRRLPRITNRSILRLLQQRTKIEAAE
jgi:hypothetical protein